MQKLYNLFHSFVGPLIEIVCVTTQWTHNTPPQTAGHREARAGGRMNGCVGCSASYPGIGALFRVASSQHTKSLVQFLFVGESLVNVCAVFTRCHSCNKRITGHKDADKDTNTGVSGTTVLTNDCFGREFGSDHVKEVT